MGAEVEHHLLLTLSQDHAICQSRQSGSDLDGPAAGIVHDTVGVAPSVYVPRPAGDWVINQGCPEEGPDQERKEAASFSYSARNDSSCDSAELHLDQLDCRCFQCEETYLIESVEQGGDQGRTGTRLTKRAPEPEMVQIADKAIRGSRREGKGIAPEVPLDIDDGAGGHTRPHHGKSRLSSSKTRVEETETWNHHQDL